MSEGKRSVNSRLDDEHCLTKAEPAPWQQLQSTSMDSPQPDRRLLEVHETLFFLPESVLNADGGVLRDRALSKGREAEHGESLGLLMRTSRRGTHEQRSDEALVTGRSSSVASMLGAPTGPPKLMGSRDDRIRPHRHQELHMTAAIRSLLDGRQASSRAETTLARPCRSFHEDLTQYCRL